MKRLFFLVLILSAAATLPCTAQNGDGLRVSVTPDTRMTGRGDSHATLMRIAIPKADSTKTIRMLSCQLIGTTNPSDITNLMVFISDDSHFDIDKPSTRLVSFSGQKWGDILFPLEISLNADTTYMWIVARVSEEARESHEIVLTLTGITTADAQNLVPKPYPVAKREIILRRTTLFRPGDFDSQFFRIPAVITAKDGSLVAATDRRKQSNADLPEDIDIILYHSTDNGLSWRDPHFLALGAGKGKGFGDCALAHTRDEGGLIAVYAGGVGFWQSRPDEPLRIYCRRSTDNGRTWSPAVDITRYLYGSDCPDPVRRQWWGAFCASGNGLLTSTGRIMFVAAVREGEAWSANDYVFYSDDNGETWQCSQRACVGGDEAKLVELRDGRILMSIRHQGKRWFNISEDGGITWRDTVFTTNFPTAPACNGDMLRYDLPDGTDILLHSLPLGSERKNVAVMLSFDDGKSWPLGKVVVPYSAAYSSLCLLPDGTIGMYVEEAPDGGDRYEMVFYNFTLEWLEGKPR